MNEKHLSKIADELNIALQQVKATARLLKEVARSPSSPVTGRRLPIPLMKSP